MLTFFRMLGAQLDNLFREAAMASLRESVQNIRVSHPLPHCIFFPTFNKQN